MKSVIIIPKASSESWRYWFSIERVAATGEHSLTVDSQCMHSRDPNHKERQLQVNASTRDLLALRNMIDGYLAMEEARKEKL